MPIRVALFRTTLFDGGERQIVPSGVKPGTLAKGRRPFGARVPSASRR
jgi:hypothetical protein